MQFQVPQFIEIEDKIFGPLTLKQFLYLAGGAGAVVALYIYIPYKIIAILLIIPLAGFSLALTYKINGKPFIDVVQSFFYYTIGSKLYLWKKAEEETRLSTYRTNTNGEILSFRTKMSGSKLKDLTWSLDIKESLNPVTREENNNR